MSAVSFHGETGFIHAHRTCVVTVSVTRSYVGVAIGLIPRDLLAYVGHITLTILVNCLPISTVVPAHQYNQSP